MATDPYNLASDDIKRRMQQLQERGAIVEQPRPAGGLSRPTAATAPQPARPRAQFSDDGPSVDSATDRRAAGLTRVFKTRDARGNSVYTDQPVRGGETRYYGATGMRADAEFDPRTGRDVAFDANTQPGRDRLFANADTQRRSLGRMIADADAVREGRDPSNPQGLQWEQTENGPRVTTAAERAAAAKGRGAGGSGMSIGDQVALLRLQNDIQRQGAEAEDRALGRQLQERGLQRQEASDMRKFARENPEAFLREELGRLRGASREELDAFFKTDQGRFVQSALDDSLGRIYSDRAPALGGGMLADRPSNFGDLQEAPWWSGTISDLFGGQRYVTPNDQFQRGVTLEDLGLAEGDGWLLDYFAQRNARGQ